ncbi:MAG: hypothetical protein LBD24_00215 [Spirochaetaceae bacterium]|nr:hypothetical protein [Spirochaetaceae bacterium]
MASYMLFWTKDRIGYYMKNGDQGPLSVIFGGPHRSQPPLGKVAAGDILFPITVINGKMYLLGRMEIDKIINERAYIKEILLKSNPEITEWAKQKNRDPEYILWDEYCYDNKKTITHKIPWNCTDNAALGKNGTKITKRALPESKTGLIKIGPEEKPLKIKDGNILTPNLIGHFRRLHKTSEEIFNEIIENTNE